jgi:mono/diheme cytochrome c family protein
MIRWILMAVLIFVLGLSVWPLFVLGHGLKAQQPGALEDKVMQIAKHKLLVGDIREKNPLRVSPETLADGKEAFSHYCVACHGMDGQNTGVPFADRMSPPVPSLATAEIQNYSDGQLKWVIDNGIWPSGMPGSNGMLSDEEIWSIVIYLRHLPPAGSAGEPEMYSH